MQGTARKMTATLLTWSLTRAVVFDTDDGRFIKSRIIDAIRLQFSLFHCIVSKSTLPCTPTRRIFQLPLHHQDGSPADKPAAFESVILVCVVQSPQFGKLSSLSASVTGQLTTETFRLGSESRETSVSSASYAKSTLQYLSPGRQDRSRFYI